METMSPIKEVFAQLLGLSLAVYLIYRAYAANRSAEPFSLRANLRHHDFSKGLDSTFIAGGFVIGFVIIALLAHKLLTCGSVCWS